MCWLRTREGGLSTTETTEAPFAAHAAKAAHTALLQALHLFAGAGTGELTHELLHVVKLLEQGIDLLHLNACTGSDSLLPAVAVLLFPAVPAVLLLPEKSHQIWYLHPHPGNTACNILQSLRHC